MLTLYVPTVPEPLRRTLAKVPAAETQSWTQKDEDILQGSEYEG